MTQVHLTVALTLDTGLAADRAILARLLASDPREEPAPETLPPQDEPPAEEEEAPPPSAATQARQAAAAKARAAKAAKQAAPTTANGAGSLAEDLAGPTDPGPGTEDDMGLDDPALSPTEARDAGLAVVREIYAAGKVQEVKMLQKFYGVAKFYDVPEARGHEFHRHVLDVARSVGLRP